MAPYSTRAKEGAPVAAPVTRAEVEADKIGRRRLAPDMFTAADTRVLLKRGDVWPNRARGASLPSLQMAAAA